jgi:exosortase/archaeosortase family protein
MRHIARFIIGILAFYILFVGILYLLPLERIVAYIVGNVLGAEVFGDYVLYSGYVFEIVDLCSGRLELALVLAFIFATPDRSWRGKLIGGALSVPFIFVFNVIRIVSVITAAGGNLMYAAFLHEVSFRVFLFITLIGYYFLWYTLSFKLRRGLTVWVFSKLVMIVFLFLLFTFMLFLLDMIQTRSYMWQAEALVMRISDNVFDVMYSESVNVTTYVILPIRLPEKYILDPGKKNYGIRYILEMDVVGNRLEFLIKDKIRDRYLAGYSLNTTGFDVVVHDSEVDPEIKQKLVIKKIVDKLEIKACGWGNVTCA